jgi:uncharacterized protein (DUF2336 family)
MRKKDVVLMATVTSFDSLQHPTKSELRQFAELFLPLFQASTEDAKRQAVASLSQCSHVPPAVALFIASQPIGVCATFLTSSQSLDDQTLITIARTQGSAHAKAIVRRAALSPTVIDALVGLRHARTRTSPDTIDTLPLQAALAAMIAAAPDAGPHFVQTIETIEPLAAQNKAEAPVEALIAVPVQANVEPPVQANLAPPAELAAKAAEIAPPQPDDAEIKAEALRLARDEVLRQQIKQLARHLGRPDSDRLGVRTVSPMQEALLVRFARNREAGHFATTLADTLSASRWLAERIMLDTSGLQLATTLTGLGMETADALVILQTFYPHLSDSDQGSPAAKLLASLDWRDCENRVEAWRRADSYTYQTPQQAPMHAPAAEATEAAEHATTAPPAAANAHGGNVAIFGATASATTTAAVVGKIDAITEANAAATVTTGTRRVPLYMAGRGRA